MSIPKKKKEKNPNNAIEMNEEIKLKNNINNKKKNK